MILAISTDVMIMPLAIIIMSHPSTIVLVFTLDAQTPSLAIMMLLQVVTTIAALTQVVLIRWRVIIS